jgi:DNA-binding MarR family transcriptional regulator
VSTDPLRAEFDRTIHEPGRLSVMANLAVVDEADFVYLTNRTELTPGNIASHISKLEAAGYVEAERTPGHGRRRTVYRLTPHGRRAFTAYREQVRAFLAASE